LSQVEGTVIRISAVADSREFKIELPRTRVGAASGKSVIAKQHADASMAAKQALSPPQTMRDSNGRSYQTSHRITLRCAIDDAAQTFSEVFYVADDLVEYDAILRKNAGSE
jgi:hypothetical protein